MDRINEKNNKADMHLECVDCGKVFLFSAGEQAYFFSKQLSVPKRCRDCRAERKRRLVPDSEVGHGH